MKLGTLSLGASPRHGTGTFALERGFAFALQAKSGRVGGQRAACGVPTWTFFLLFRSAALLLSPLLPLLLHSYLAASCCCHISTLLPPPTTAPPYRSQHLALPPLVNQHVLQGSSDGCAGTATLVIPASSPSEHQLTFALHRTSCAAQSPSRDALPVPR